jgi:hypothetical protein
LADSGVNCRIGLDYCGDLAGVLIESGGEIEVNPLSLRFEDEFAWRQECVIGICAVELLFGMAILPMPAETIKKQLIDQMEPCISLITPKVRCIGPRPRDKPLHLNSALLKVHWTSTSRRELSYGEIISNGKSASRQVSGSDLLSAKTCQMPPSVGLAVRDGDRMGA